MKHCLDPETYEKARISFRRLMSQTRYVFTPYRPERDQFVTISRIYTRNQTKFLAFIRIQPRGFMTPKKVASDSKVALHLIKGSGVLGHNDKLGFMSTGQYITLKPGTVYTITNPDLNLDTVYLIQYVDLKTKRELISPARNLAIEAPPSRRKQRPENTSDRVLRKERKPTEFFTPDQPSIVSRTRLNCSPGAGRANNFRKSNHK